MRLIMEQGNHQLSIGKVLEITEWKWVNLSVPRAVIFTMDPSASRLAKAVTGRSSDYILRSAESEDIIFRGTVSDVFPDGDVCDLRIIIEATGGIQFHG